MDKSFFELLFYRKKSGVFSTTYKNEHVNMNTDVDLDAAAPKMHGAAVFQ